jgi:two-component system, OmpR family, sensor kinase
MTKWYRAARAWPRTHLKTHVVVALLVFLATFAASIYYWSNIRTNVQKDLNTAYQRQVRIATTAMTSRLQQYENLLRGGAGLFTVTDVMTQSAWTNYFQPYDVTNHYPEIEGVGFSRYLTRDEVPGYRDQMRAQGRDIPQITPAGDRPAYVPVTYNAIYNGNTGKSFGYDGYTDKTRRSAMDKAAASGAPVMSGKIELVSQAQPRRPAFIIYLPVYKKDMPTATAAQRQVALYGFVYVAVDIHVMFEDVTRDNQNAHFAMSLYDTQDQSHDLAYQMANTNALRKQHGVISTDTSLQLYGHTWQARLSGSPDLISESERQLPLQALWRGFLSSVLFAGVVWYLITSRERKFTRQKQQEVQTAKDDLLSLASHQLRTPATVVKQYVGMLLQGYSSGKLTDQQINMLTHAYESNERQLEIINQLLYVARLDAGRITLRLEKVPIAPLLTGVIADQAETAAERCQQVEFKPPKRNLTLEGDPHYLRMVFENLLSNAVKYTPEGGKITLTAQRDKDDVVVHVSDNGVGISEKERERIFDKFTRVENELSTDVNGSGVGLYLTQQIVELHSGHIEVAPRPGGGSTFTVRLPVRGPRQTDKKGQA